MGSRGLLHVWYISTAYKTPFFGIVYEPPSVTCLEPSGSGRRDHLAVLTWMQVQGSHLDP